VPGVACKFYHVFLAGTIVLFSVHLTKAGDLLLKPTRRHMEANLLLFFKTKVKLVYSQLKEADAAITGAGALVDPL
jgi:glucokinase